MLFTISLEKSVKNLNPLLQCVVAFVMGVVVILYNHLVYQNHADEYSGAIVGILFFAIANNIISIFKPKFKTYSLPSYLLYFLLAAVLMLLAKYFSGVSIWKLSVFRLMFVSVTSFYLVTSVMVRIIRAIYQFAESEEA